jgi:hypothetical protein
LTCEEEALSTTPTIPLPDNQRQAYEDLYNTLETQYQSTADATVLEAVGPARDNVSDVLTKDDLYKFSQDTNLFAALQAQITSTNSGLQTLKTQIQATASHFSLAGDILSGIAKVLTFFS